METRGGTVPTEKSLKTTVAFVGVVWYGQTPPGHSSQVTAKGRDTLDVTGRSDTKVTERHEP